MTSQLVLLKRACCIVGYRLGHHSQQASVCGPQALRRNAELLNESNSETEKAPLNTTSHGRRKGTNFFHRVGGSNILHETGQLFALTCAVLPKRAAGVVQVLSSPAPRGNMVQRQLAMFARGSCPPLCVRNTKNGA